MSAAGSAAFGASMPKNTKDRFLVQGGEWTLVDKGVQQGMAYRGPDGFGGKRPTNAASTSVTLHANVNVDTDLSKHGRGSDQEDRGHAQADRGT